MNVKEYIIGRIKGSSIGKRLYEDKHHRTVVKAVLSFIFNLLFVFYNGILGILSHSIIFIISSFCYLLFSVMRFLMLLFSKKDKNGGAFSSVIGVMLIILSIVFCVAVYVSTENNTATVYGTITMITIATFTFTKIAVAVITAVKSKGETYKFYTTVNTVRYAEVAISLLSMQQSMLVSFENPGENSFVILNIFTGSAVCLFIFILGIITLKSKDGS